MRFLFLVLSTVNYCYFKAVLLVPFTQRLLYRVKHVYFWLSKIVERIIYGFETFIGQINV